MTRNQQALAGVGAALVAASLSACQGADASAEEVPPPTAPTADEFCAVWEDALDGLGTTGAAGPSDEQWEVVRADLVELAGLGAPDELSDDAAAGLAVFADALTALSGSDMRRLSGAANLPGVTDEDEALARQFNSEAAALCAPAGSLGQ